MKQRIKVVIAFSIETEDEIRVPFYYIDLREIAIAENDYA